MVLAWSLLLPMVLNGCLFIAMHWLPLTARWRLSLREAHRAMSRAGLAVTALSIAAAATIGVAIMVTSFRGSLDTWLQKTLRADVYISAGQVGHSPRALPDELIEQVRAISDQRIITNYTTHIPLPDGSQWKVSVTDIAAEDRAGFVVAEGSMDSDNDWEAFLHGAAWISEAFAEQQQYSVGDQLPFPTTSGIVQLPIQAVIRDYGAQAGLIYVHHQWYRQDVPGHPRTAIGSFSTTDQPDVLIQNLQRALEPWPHVTIQSSQHLQDWSLRVFDRTFTITDALQWLAMAVALLGLAIAGMALILERRRDWAILRAMGWNRGQLTRLAWQQNTVYGILAACWAIPLGAAIGWLLITVINQRSFGWSIDWSWPTTETFLVLTLSIITAALSGLLPGRLVAKLPAARILRDE